MARLTMKEFTSGGSWTAPAGVTNIILVGYGGGAGGMGGRNNIGDLGLGGCGVMPYMIQVSVTPNTSYTVTIGAGGTAGAARTNTTVNGGAGGATTFGALATFKGGANVYSSTGTTAYTTVSRPYASFYWNTTNTSLFIQTPDEPVIVRNSFGNNGSRGTDSGSTYFGGMGGCPGYGDGGNGGNSNNSGTGVAGTAAAANSGAGGGAGGAGFTGGVGGAGGSGRLWVMWVE